MYKLFIQKVISRVILQLGKEKQFYAKASQRSNFLDNSYRVSCLSSQNIMLHSTMAQGTDQDVVRERNHLVHVQKNPGSKKIFISFEYETNESIKNFNLSRTPSESLASSLERIKLNLLKVEKKSKGNTTKITDQPSLLDGKISLSVDGVKLEPNNITNSEAWVDGAILDIDGRHYCVTINPPFVEGLKLPNCMLKDYIVMPIVKLQNCSIENCKFAWYRSVLSKDRKILVMKGHNEIDFEFDGRGYWLKLSDKLSYCPTEDDVSQILKITCWPIDGQKNGMPVYSICYKPVELGPTECPFQKRHELTKDYTTGSNEFRVVSYNILADLYADSDYSREVLFRHCPGKYLDFDYRRQLLLKELLGYHADLICLQEVDKKEYIRTFEPFMKLVGNHVSVFNTKGGQVAEGVATFYRKNKFELIDTHRTILSELIESRDIKDEIHSNENIEISGQEALKGDNTYVADSHPILHDRSSETAKDCLARFEAIRTIIISKPELKKRFMDRHTILQTTLLKVKDLTDRYILLANTHLYFAPDADHVRLLQGSVCAKYLEYIKQFYSDMLAKTNGSSPILSIILCGDMNSTPDCGFYKLLTTGNVGQDLPDWSSNKEEAVEGLSVDTCLRFRSAYENVPYTNYTPEFNGCLDYIYYDCDSLKCESVVPLPTHEVVTAVGGIPSRVFPSDHLALIGNLKGTR